MGYHLPCHSFSTKEQTAYPFFSRFIYPVYFFCIPFPPPHLTFPLSPPPPQPPFFSQKKEAPTFSYSFQLQIYVHVFFCTQRFVCFILLSISPFNCTPNRYTLCVTSLHITVLSFMSLVYFGSFFSCS